MHIDIILPQFKKKSQEKVIPNLYKKKKKKTCKREEQGRASTTNLTSHLRVQKRKKSSRIRIIFWSLYLYEPKVVYIILRMVGFPLLDLLHFALFGLTNNLLTL